MHGNHALALGALAGGCRFVAAYPMTPATSIFEYLASIAAGCGVVTKHAEDEIAAICMAIGAAHAGARAMTPTSGGGFSLMVEALGLAGMAEVPLVVVNVQRGGPSTGLPTRTEQGDLLFALHASQGEFPRIVLAPGTIEECFEAGWRALNLAEKYQCPVIVLSDLYLAGSLRTVEPEALDFASVPVERGALLSGDELDGLSDGYRRFAFTQSGVSPRAVPSTSTRAPGLFVTTSMPPVCRSAVQSRRSTRRAPAATSTDHACDAPFLESFSSCVPGSTWIVAGVTPFGAPSMKISLPGGVVSITRTPGATGTTSRADDDGHPSVPAVTPAISSTAAAASFQGMRNPEDCSCSASSRSERSSRFNWIARLACFDSFSRMGASGFGPVGSANRIGADAGAAKAGVA